MWISLQGTAIGALMHLSPFSILAFTLFTFCSVGKEPGQAESSGETLGNPSAEFSSNTSGIANGDTVQLDYTGTLTDGSVFDQSQAGSPLTFTVGAGQVIPGFDKAVLGMALHEEKKFTIPAADAYGEHNEAMVQRFGRTMFPAEMSLEVGQVLGFQTQDGNQVPGTITVFDKDSVSVDFNHALAGKDLTFAIKIVAIN